MKITIQKHKNNYRLTKGKFVSKSTALKKCSQILLIGIGNRLLIVREVNINPYTRLRSYLKYKLPFLIKKNRKTLKLWVREVVLKKPIYYEYFSRDCDCVEVSGYNFVVGRKEFDYNQQMMYDGAEGECWMLRCSKEKYEQYGDEVYKRDRIMEAYENGRGNQINI